MVLVDAADSWSGRSALSAVGTICGFAPATKSRKKDKHKIWFCHSFVIVAINSLNDESIDPSVDYIDYIDFTHSWGKVEAAAWATTVRSLRDKMELGSTGQSSGRTEEQLSART